MIMKVWDTATDKDDVVRFVLRRSEWHALIDALASSASQNSKAWDGLDVLRLAEVDVEASAMVKALTQIVKYTHVRKPDHNDMTIIRTAAETGLKEGAPKAEKESQAA
jgi:hypothetical protein